MTDLYKDTCVIQRSKGTVTVAGVEEFDTLLSCSCTLQIGSSGDTALKNKSYKSGSIVIMAYTEVLLQTNDMVTVTTDTGRIIKGTIKNYDSVNWEGIQGTTIWLKDGEE